MKIYVLNIKEALEILNRLSGESRVSMYYSRTAKALLPNMHDLVTKHAVPRLLFSLVFIKYDTSRYPTGAVYKPVGPQICKFKKQSRKKLHNAEQYG